MSSILNALKKLEDDKTSRRPDQLKIDADILKTDNAPRFSTSGVIIISLLLLSVGSGATYMFMKREKPTELAALKSSPVAPSRPNQPSGSPAPDIKTEQLPAAVVVVPANQQKTVKAKPETSMRSQVPKNTGVNTASTKPVAAPIKIEQPATMNQSAPPTTTKTIPSLRVNGIAFEDGGSDNVAVINGVPVSNGSVIDGVKVEEIQKTRVKFSYNGEKFEIPLGQSNR